MTKALRAIGLLLRMGFPWPGLRNDPWSRAARRALLKRWPIRLRPAVWPLSALIWPLSSFWQSIAAARRAPPGPKRLWLACWRAALTRNIPPNEFVLYRLYRPGAPEGGWRFEMETAILLPQLTDPAVTTLTRDKRAFHDWLVAMDVPVAPLLDALPEGEAVTKPRFGVRGQGMTFWTPEGGMWRPRAGFGRRRNPPVPAKEILKRIADRDLLLQPAIPPHPALDCAVVARILTHRPNLGAPAQTVAAAAQTPALADRASHRGPWRIVCAATGEIQKPGPGLRAVLSRGVHARMPLEGAILPDWNKIARALEAAHDALEGRAPMLGWDVIWGPDGPLTLEANVGLSMAIFQIDGLKPAGIPDIAP